MSLEIDKKPKLKDIVRLVKPFAYTKWYDIGLELEVGDEDGVFLDQIKNSQENDQERFMEMIKTWIRSDDLSKVTWKTLLDCLKELKITEAVDRVEHKFQISTTTQPSLPGSQHADSASLTALPSNTRNPVPESNTPSQQSPTNTTITTLSTPQSSESPMLPLYIEPAPDIPVTVNAPTALNPIEMISSSQHNPPDEQVDAPISGQPLGYELQLPPGHVIRNYQHELARPGINGENYIFVAPTGSGKTLVTAIIITEHLKKLQALGELPRVVFLVNTKPLAIQQQESLQKYIKNARVECIMGDSIGNIKDALPEHEVVVCTTGKFLDELKRDWITIASQQEDLDKIKITLIVIDECHHARKSSVQAQVMHRYLKHKHKNSSATLPQVIGLTASPGAGENPNLEYEKTIDHLVNLCALLDATSGIVTVQDHVDELERYTTKPTLDRKVLPSRSPTEPFIQLIEKEMKELEKFADLKNSFPKWSQQYETTAHQKKMPLELSTNPKCRDQISTLKLLICYCQALNIYMDLREEDALKTLDDFCDLPDNDPTCTEHERTLKLGLNALKTELRTLDKVKNPLLQEVEQVLRTKFHERQESRGVFFVHTKRHAYAVCDWLKSLSTTFLDIKPEVITGHTRENGSGMTQADQELAMENFRSGDRNILVATSVAEEGLDVPACNFVIRFQHVSNEIAKAQTQGRARAEDSEVITIMSSESGMHMKEIQNAERLELVDTIIKNRWFPAGQRLKEQLREQQDNILRKCELKHLFKQHVRSAQRENIKLLCRKCKTIACFGSDIFKTADEGAHHVVPGEEIKAKLIKKPHHKPGQITETISKTHKIYCKECDADWGVMCVWTVEGFKFPVLKCKSFAFQEDRGHPFPVSQWSKAPFQPLPLDAWIAEQQDKDKDEGEVD